MTLKLTKSFISLVTKLATKSYTKICRSWS
jgi:hypothetical protein